MILIAMEEEVMILIAVEAEESYRHSLRHQIPQSAVENLMISDTKDSLETLAMTSMPESVTPAPSTRKAMKHQDRPGFGTSRVKCLVQVADHDLRHYDQINLKMEQSNNYENDLYAKEFGIQVANAMATVEARVMQPPQLKYHDSSKEKPCNPHLGAWNMINKRGNIEAALKPIHGQVCKALNAGTLQLLLVILPDATGSYGMYHLLVNTPFSCDFRVGTFWLLATFWCVLVYGWTAF